MNRDQMEGRWKELKGSARQKWADLTDADLDRVNGRRMELVGMIQKRYGKAKEQAEREVSEWLNSLAEPAGTATR